MYSIYYFLLWWPCHLLYASSEMSQTFLLSVSSLVQVGINPMLKLEEDVIFHVGFTLGNARLNRNLEVHVIFSCWIDLSTECYVEFRRRYNFSCWIPTTKMMSFHFHLLCSLLSHLIFLQNLVINSSTYSNL